VGDNAGHAAESIERKQAWPLPRTLPSRSSEGQGVRLAASPANTMMAETLEINEHLQWVFPFFCIFTVLLILQFGLLLHHTPSVDCAWD
jgi:hypothetical protein